jgi:hypothetical protein
MSQTEGLRPDEGAGVNAPHRVWWGGDASTVSWPHGEASMDDGDVETSIVLADLSPKDATRAPGPCVDDEDDDDSWSLLDALEPESHAVSGLVPVSPLDNVSRLRASVSSLAVKLRQQELLCTYWRSEADAGRAEAAAAREEANAQADRAREAEEETAWLRVAAEELVGGRSAALVPRGWDSCSPGLERGGGGSPPPLASESGTSLVVSQLRGQEVERLAQENASLRQEVERQRIAAIEARAALEERYTEVCSETKSLRAEIERLNQELAREGVVVGARMREAQARQQEVEDREHEAWGTRQQALSGLARAEAALVASRREVTALTDRVDELDAALGGSRRQLLLAEEAVDQLHGMLEFQKQETARWRSMASSLEERLLFQSGGGRAKSRSVGTQATTTPLHAFETKPVAALLDETKPLLEVQPRVFMESITGPVAASLEVQPRVFMESITGHVAASLEVQPRVFMESITGPVAASLEVQPRVFMESITGPVAASLEVQPRVFMESITGHVAASLEVQPRVFMESIQPSQSQALTRRVQDPTQRSTGHRSRETQTTEKLYPAHAVAMAVREALAHGERHMLMLQAELELERSRRSIELFDARFRTEDPTALEDAVMQSSKAMVKSLPQWSSAQDDGKWLSLPKDK